MKGKFMQDGKREFTYFCDLTYTQVRELFVTQPNNEENEFGITPVRHVDLLIFYNPGWQRRLKVCSRHLSVYALDCMMLERSNGALLC